MQSMTALAATLNPEGIPRFSKPAWIAECYAATASHPPGFSTRLVEAGCFASMAAGRMGRRSSSPPQLGQTPPRRRVATQSAQKVHS
jgi:hypothetical protein